MDSEKIVALGEFINKSLFDGSAKTNPAFDEGVILFTQQVHALLKEQEARILNWDELEDWGNAVWFEDNDEHECYIALIANVGAYDAKFTNVEPGNIHSLVFMRDFYMKEWRCWSARPTIKQRQAVKWE